MKLIIDILEDTYTATCGGFLLPPDVKNVVNAIKNGTPLPKEHGKIVDIGQIDNDRIERDNPVIYLTVNGECIEAVSLDYLNSLPAIVEAEAFHCGFEESGGHAYNCNDCPNKCEEWYQWDKEI